MNFIEFKEVINEKYALTNERYKKETAKVIDFVSNKNRKSIIRRLNSGDNDQIKKVMDKIERDVKNIMDYQKDKEIRLVSDTDVLYVDILLKEIESNIEEIRLQLFNSKEVPFANLEDSSNWIYEMSNIIDNKKAYNKNLNNFKNIFNGQTYKVKTISFRNGDNKIERITSEYNNKLSYLKYCVEKLSNYSRFSEADITTYILVGLKPEFPRYKLTTHTSGQVLPDGKKRISTWFTIELNAGDIRFDEIKEIYDFYRKKLNIKSEKPVKEDSNKLVDFIINEIKELPPGYHLKSNGKKTPRGTGDKMYWEEVLLKWNEAHPDTAYKRWDYIEKAYYRTIIKKKGV